MTVAQKQLFVVVGDIGRIQQRFAGTFGLRDRFPYSQTRRQDVNTDSNNQNPSQNNPGQYDPDQAMTDQSQQQPGGGFEDSERNRDPRSDMDDDEENYEIEQDDEEMPRQQPGM
jgi:hypothetical protein